MLDQLLNYIKKQKLFQPGDKIVLAVSGGIDSMVMLNLFQKTNFSYAIAHCNFKLRGEESNADQLLVEQTAAECKVPYFFHTFQTRDYAEKHGISIQMAARELRQEWFSELLKNEGYDWIATGHHLNDSFETALFNLAKGTGISGLKGIPPKNNRYIRPLMFASREMILDYAREQNIIWNEDRSNQTIKYHRNLIRHQIVPELKKINPNLEETFASSMEKIEAAERIYQNSVHDIKEALIEPIDDVIRLDKGKINCLHEAGMYLYEILNEYGFNFQQVKDILIKMNGQPGKTFYSKNHQLIVDRKYLFISNRPEKEDIEISFGADAEEVVHQYGQLILQKIDIGDVAFSGDENIAFLDFDRLKFPLAVRPWRQGDRFQPLGMRHKKKLSDFMIDEKIPLNLKRQVLVLTSGDEVVWIIGLRIDDRYKITGKTRNVYKIYNISVDDKSF